MSFSHLKGLPWPRARGCVLYCWLLLVIPAVSFVTLSPLSAAEKPPPQIIILNSYHTGFTWSDGEMAGVLQELRRVYPKIDPAIEYLDTKRFPMAEYLLKMKDYLASKYRGRKFDLVIALDNAALELALGHRQELFPESPIVFAGINDFTPAMLTGQKKVTGVAEILDTEGTLKIALALHPKITEIFVVTDDTISGKAARQEIKAVMLRLPANVQFKFAPPATMAELIEQIKRLPATAIIFIAGFATDKAGQTFSAAEGVRRLTQEAKVPAYIVHEARLGHGSVGGNLLGGGEEGRRAGEIALRVLAGEDPARIPVDTKSTARPMFDYRQMARFKIPLGALPPGSIVIHRPSSFYEIHQSWVWGTFGAILTLGLVVLVLGVNVIRRRRAENELQHHLNFIQNLLDTIPNPVFYKDTAGVYQGCNEALKKFLGLTQKEIIGKTVFDTYPKELAEKYAAMDQQLFDHPGVQVYEFIMDKPDGTRRNFIFNKATFLDSHGALGGLIGVMTDITECKQAEEEVRHQREELRALASRLSEIQESERQELARELHDKVCQNLTSINIALETLMIRAQREPIDQLMCRLANVGAIAEKASEITRNIMESLRPTVLDHYGLIGGLRQLGSQLSHQMDIKLEVQGEDADIRLNPQVEIALFRIAQEALNNVAKYARASHLVLTQEVDQDTVRMVIADNGVGFDPSLVDQPKGGRGWGLMTMNERAMAVGGHCSIESQPGQGTRVVVEVPCE
jgi:PAS domain S-box-containing protein